MLLMLVKTMILIICLICCLDAVRQVMIVHVFSPSHCPSLPLTDQGATTVLGYHTANGGMTPTASDQQYNPVRDNNTDDRCPIDATVSYSLIYMCMYKILLICIL